MPAPKAWTYSPSAALLLLAPFNLLASLGMDAYLPVVPLMSQALSTSPAIIQLTLSLYLLVLGSGQLAFGPLSDRIGRRPVLLVGATLFTVTSAALAFTSSGPTFVTLRVVQAAAGAATLVATLATVRDAYGERREGALVYGLLGSILGIVPALGPVLGAAIDWVVGWRGIFLLLAGLGLLASVQALLRWPETRPAGHAGMRMSHVYEILGSAPFWLYASGYSAAMGAFFVYFSTAPRVLLERAGLGTFVFSMVFATVALVMIATSCCSSRLVARWGERGCLIRGMVILSIGAGGLALGQALAPFSVWSFVAPMWIVAVGIAVICPAATSGALRPFGHAAGTASALYGAIESMAVSCAGTLAVLSLPSDTAWPLIAFCALSALVTIGLAFALSPRGLRQGRREAVVAEGSGVGGRTE
jgi:DHA1 family florfenicol/chloramphenicol resistance protein-like MFS transporter